MRRRLTLLVALFAFAALIVAPAAARAHGTRSVSVDVTEVAPGRAVVHMRATLPEDAARVRAVFAAPCTSGPSDDDGTVVTAVTCPGSLSGSRVTVDGLGPVLSEAIVIVSLQDGQRLSHVVTEAEPTFTLPAAQSGFAVARSYVRLGVVHILTGYDHLLFLLSLVLLLRRPRAVLLAESAFTVSHSISFSATALGLVRVYAPAAEAAIALSLVLVALDVGKEGDGASAREGAAMAFVFGLVHGLGFAGGLSEIGLPDAHVSLALLGFAAGVEIGQVAFLAVALVAFHLAARRLVQPRLEAAVRSGSVLVGGVSFYWLIERTLACFSFRT
jgi:hydrogenase/urease accessory protein HupE